MRKERKSKKVAVALSGGVDSSVAAALLKKAGINELHLSSRSASARAFDVVGIFMRLNGFSSLAEARARKVAKILKIPFLVFDFEKEFEKRIVNCFLKEIKQGLTPNPCVTCNKEIKFGLFLERALKLDVDFIATGHYARVKDGRLLAAKDKDKDQNYFLHRLSQKQLKRVLFPIGEYTRQEVEKMAKKLKLPFAGVRKSQEICFIPKTVEEFLKSRIKLKLGQIVDAGGNVLGKHKGLHFYTIGQRKGIRLSGGPYYVLSKDFKKNILIVTKNEKDLLKKELFVNKVNWVSGKEPVLPLLINAKIRYRQKSAAATIVNKLKSRQYRLSFNKAQRAVTPGQSVVFYRGQEVLGGGIISLN